ncbi:hypothetical protein [Thalassobacillus sp. C254]|uniref:hypothetical protein n=1 Tax=Thalassobacillus sp. C254 TaxID=1225341 RepID=UPI0012EED6DB|nr:hypothetical protein [Thalassobacillus sp. C254]
MGVFLFIAGAYALISIYSFYKKETVGMVGYPFASLGAALIGLSSETTLFYIGIGLFLSGIFLVFFLKDLPQFLRLRENKS